MVSQDVPRNTAQRAGNIFVISARVVNANNGVYTVPAGKRARITNVLGIVDALGTDPSASIARLRSLVFTGLTIPRGVGIEQFISAVTFEAGDTLTNIGNTGGTNTTFDLSASVEEFSV